MTNLKHLSQLFKALGNERRLKIIQKLKKNGASSVTAISKDLKISVAAASEHLQQLAAEGIITSKNRGKYVTYRISLSLEPIVKNIVKEL